MYQKKERLKDITLRSLLRASVGDCPQQPIAAEEGEQCQRDEVPNGFEHVQLQPEHTEQGQDGSEPQVETDRTQREREIADVDPKFGPQQEEQDEWCDAQTSEKIRHHTGWAFLGDTELMDNLRQRLTDGVGGF